MDHICLCFEFFHLAIELSRSTDLIPETHDTMNEHQPTAQHGHDRLTAEDWQQRYLRDETGWDRGSCNPALMRWLKSKALQPCRILVPGCGRGYEVVELAARGFDVTAVDFARAPVQQLLKRLEERHLRAEVRQDDMLQFVASQEFTAVYEQTSLCAIDPQHWPLYEETLARSLLPGGRLYALFMQSGKTDGPPFSCELGQMRRLFADTRWVWPADHFQVPHPAGMTEIAVILQRYDAESGRSACGWMR